MHLRLTMVLAVRARGRERFLLLHSYMASDEPDALARDAAGAIRVFASDEDARAVAARELAAGVEAGELIEPGAFGQFHDATGPMRLDLDAAAAWCAAPTMEGTIAKELALVWQTLALAGAMPPIQRMDPMGYTFTMADREMGKPVDPALDAALLGMKLSFTAEYGDRLRARAAAPAEPVGAGRDDREMDAYMQSLGAWSADETARLGRLLAPAIAAFQTLLPAADEPVGAAERAAVGARPELTEEVAEDVAQALGAPARPPKWARGRVSPDVVGPTRQEILDGAVVDRPRAPDRALVFMADVGDALRAYLGEGRWMVGSYYAYVEDPERTLVRPDCFVYDRERRGRHAIPLRGVPLVLELLVPEAADVMRGARRRAYADAGVRDYWLVDVERRIVEVWRPGDERPAEVGERVAWRPEGRADDFVLDVPGILWKRFRPPG